MTALRSALFTLLFYLCSAAIVLSAAVVTFVAPTRIARFARAWGRTFLWLARHMLGVRLQVVGEVPPPGGVIVASKHQSAFETIALVALFEHPAPVLKAELIRIPVWGKMARLYGAIPVDRDGSSRSLRAMMAAAKAAAANRQPIVIFPEGSRVPVGEAPPLKAGVAGLYKMLRLPVVPMTLDSGRVWPRKSFLKRPGTITFVFGEAIPPGLPREAFEARLHAAINGTP